MYNFTTSMKFTIYLTVKCLFVAGVQKHLNEYDSCIGILTAFIFSDKVWYGEHRYAKDKAEAFLVIGHCKTFANFGAKKFVVGNLFF